MNCRFPKGRKGLFYFFCCVSLHFAYSEHLDMGIHPSLVWNSPPVSRAHTWRGVSPAALHILVLTLVNFYDTKNLLRHFLLLFGHC